jgi:hypothetical protein
MTRNLIEHRLTDAQAASIERAMRAAFEEAAVVAGSISLFSCARSCLIAGKA